MSGRKSQRPAGIGWVNTGVPVRSPTARQVSDATLWTVHDPVVDGREGGGP